MKALLKRRGIGGFILGFLLFSPISFVKEGYPETPEDQTAIRLNNIIVKKITKSVRIRARLAITEGILEYLLVSDEGKAYESVFKVAENKPSELNFALLLIGVEPLNFKRFSELSRKKKGLEELIRNHEKSLLQLEFFREGKQVRWPSLVKNREGSAPPPIWVYTGGVFTRDNKYAADLELSHMGIWPDMSAVVNLFSGHGNPYQGDFGFEMNRENKELRVDQEFEILIRRHSP